MDRVIKDHLESGYIIKVEYRAVKEPDQLIDYVIRYYPGQGATASLDRVQAHLRQRKVSRRALGTQPSKPTSVTLIPAQTTTLLSLSVVTADHERLIIELVWKFGINAIRAYDLVISRYKAVHFQLEVWPHRQVAPRNRAGWMIQAIENNYEAPTSYFDIVEKQHERAASTAAQATIRECALCDNRGFRYITSSRYPDGAMRQCTHDATVESQDTDATGPTSVVSRKFLYND
jgi:hypothetical protein